MRVLVSLCLLTLLLLSTGCATGISVATAASAASLAGSTLDTGTAVYQMGKLDSAEMASREQCVEAMRRVAAELSYHISYDKLRGGGKQRMSLVDDRHSVVDIWIDPRTPNATLVRIDVGWLGSQPTARLLLARFQYHLATVRGDPITRMGGRLLSTTQPASRPAP